MFFMDKLLRSTRLKHFPSRAALLPICCFVEVQSVPLSLKALLLFSQISWYSEIEMLFKWPPDSCHVFKLSCKTVHNIILWLTLSFAVIQAKDKFECTFNLKPVISFHVVYTMTSVSLKIGHGNTRTCWYCSGTLSPEKLELKLDNYDC